MSEDRQPEKQNTFHHSCTQGPRIAVIEKSQENMTKTLEEIKNKLDSLNEDLVNSRISEAAANSTITNFTSLVTDLQQTLVKNREYIDASMSQMVDKKTCEHHYEQVDTNTTDIDSLSSRLSSVEEDRKNDVTRIRTAWKMFAAVGVILGVIVSADRIAKMYTDPNKQLYKQIELLRKDLHDMRSEVEDQKNKEPASDRQ